MCTVPIMDKSWMMIKDRLKSKEYLQGVQSFIEFATKNLGPQDEIRCPCVDCLNGTKFTPHVVRLHLLRRGIACSYRTWVHHGEHVAVVRDRTTMRNDATESNASRMTANHENVGELPTMLEEIYMSGLMDDHIDQECSSSERHNSLKFMKLFDDAQRKVYAGCEKFSILSFVIKMLHVKVYNKWSNKSFDMVMQVFKDILPKCDETVPWTLYEAKKFLRDLGLGYEAIHACKNDCTLFWNDNAARENCPTCMESRYKLNDKTGKKIPHKILRYFPLTPRLKRLYMSNKTAAHMRWHKDKRVDDGVLRHPADGEAWKDFDRLHPTFSADPRNVRLGLATDGFNPFGNMSTSYSMWPVILMPYNLPPWKCMKDPFVMMSLLIPGRSSPGRDIDVYLQPLVEELTNLWEHGVQTYDASNDQIFTMHAAVMWTINDFPAYGSLSGWSTKGYLACPNCNMDASSQSLRSKIGYMGARRYLPENHNWRRSKLFNGEIDNRSKPVQLSGEQILEQISLGTYRPYGKHPTNQKRQRTENPTPNWTKRSILFDLPYWKTLKLRHNLDVMHIEKNICDNLLGTLLSVDGKNKDTYKARLDLEDMRIRKELHLIRHANASFEKPPALYTLSPAERQGFVDFLKSIKYPDGYAANISNCVTANGGKLVGLKSHDCHVLLQRLLPIGMRGYLPTEIGTTLFELGTFFKQLCAKTLKVTDLEKLQEQIVLILCKLEMIFPPAFFDVMVHLAIHLPYEALLGGPVQYRWMYPIERMLGLLKGFVGNKARPEGSVAEGYISKECTTFCSMYLDGIETVFNREERNYDGGDNGPGLAIFTQNVRPFGQIPRAIDVSVAGRELAHWFILHNSLEVDEYLEEHKLVLQQKYGSSCNIATRQCKEFPKWFKDRMNQLRNQKSPEATDEMWSLANGPNALVNTYEGCISNGVRFHSIDRDNRRKCQNSGLVVEGDHQGQLIKFYGYLCKVWELTYLFGHRVVLFQCEWYNTGSSRTLRVEPHVTTVDIRSRWYKDDSFVFPSQVQQVFYVHDTKLGPNWRVVEKFQHRRIWDVPELDVPEFDEVLQEDETTTVVPTEPIDDEVVLHRDDIEPEIISMEVSQSKKRVQSDRVMDDAFICDDDDDVTIAGDDEEDDEITSDFDTDTDQEF